MNTPENTREGDRVVVTELRGYRLSQDRPSACNWGPEADGRYTSNCKCGGNCNGTSVEFPGTVDEIIYWADNSVEATVQCDDGERRRLRLRAPYGDLC